MRILVILAVLLASGWILWEHHRDTGSLVRLGLDLQGGMHLVLEVDDPAGTLSDDARADAVERSLPVIRNRVDELGVAEPLIQRVGRDRLIVELAGVDDENRAREVIGQTAVLEWRMVHPRSPVETVLPRLDRAAAAALGAEAGMGASTTPEVAAAVEAEADPEPTGGVLSSRLFVAGVGGEFLVASEDEAAVRALLELPGVREALPRGVDLRWGWEPVPQAGQLYRALYVVDREPFLTGAELEDARSGRDAQSGFPVVHFELSRAGGRIFAERTGTHVGQRMAILLDGAVVSAPEIRSRIASRGVIELARAPMAEARDLALVLRAGALPAPLRVLEERTVGPSLGLDSIARGQRAGLVGLALVMLLMVVYYRWAGVLAVAALGVYVSLLLAGLALLGATLTLPGIAGFILSIGMAVDANVLIFERIREELSEGRSTRAAVEVGFARALSAIVDANVTTLITALILFQFGTGPVRGFAVTLSLGIVASFFTALYVTRTFFLLSLKGRRAPMDAPCGPTRRGLSMDARAGSASRREVHATPGGPTPRR